MASNSHPKTATGLVLGAAYVTFVAPPAAIFAGALSQFEGKPFAEGANSVIEHLDAVVRFGDANHDLVLHTAKRAVVSAIVSTVVGHALFALRRKR